MYNTRCAGTAIVWFFSIIMVCIYGVRGQPSSCDSYVYTQEDIVTGKLVRGTKAPLIVTDKDSIVGFSIHMALSYESDAIVVNIEVYGGGVCIDDDADVFVLFTDTTRLSTTVSNSFNCDRTATLYFGGIFKKVDICEQLLDKQIKALRVSTANGLVTQFFTKAQAERFRRSLRCLYDMSNMSKED